MKCITLVTLLFKIVGSAMYVLVFIDKMYLKLYNISQYYYFYCIFYRIN